MESANPWMQPRLVVATVLTAAAGWAFHAHAIKPLAQRETETRQQIEALKKQAADARRETSASRARAAEGNAGDSQPGEQRHEPPSGPALIWLPERVQQHFAQHGFTGAVARLNTAVDEKDLPGYERSYWRVAIPLSGSRDTPRLLRAVAELDAPDSFLRVVDFAVGPDPQNPVRQAVSMNVSALLPK